MLFVLSGGLTKNKNGAWQSDGLYGTIPGSNLRLIAATYLFTADPDKQIIVSGSKGHLDKIPGSPPLASIMKNELVALGIPAGNIQKEHRSNNTFQQLQALKKILVARHPKKICIVSNTYHLGRIRALISQLKFRQKVTLVSAERVILKHIPTLRTKINRMYASSRMKKIILLEKHGIKQIKSGTYNLSQNTSQSDRYL